MKSFTKLALAGFLAALIGISGCDNNAAARDRAAEILRVEVAALELIRGYQVQRNFAGRVEAPRQSQLGFEVGGELIEVRVNEGDTVAGGAVLAKLDAERLRAAAAEARASLANAQAEQELAQSTLERSEAAVQFDGVSEQELDQARQRAAATAAGVQAAQARLQRIELDIKKSTLRAPYDATVVGRLADEGEIVATGRAVLQLQETGDREVRMGLSRDVAQTLKAGETRSLTLGKQIVDATLTAIIPARDPATRTVDVIFAISADRALPGDLAYLTVSEEQVGDGFWVPMAALVEGSRGLWSLYVVIPAKNADGATHVLEARAVEVIHQQTDRIFVRGAIQAGEQFVTDGVHRVVSGQPVRVVESDDAN